MQSNPKHNLIVERDPASGSWGVTARALVDRVKKLVRHAIAARASAFPNNLGNYRGNRKAKPAGRPFTPEERFDRLRGLYACHRRAARKPR